ncbi:Flagellar secretion chaperone FliS [Georgfuchsia toluolica]|uniref:Flagellar secretion chaperone FliS n=1 Tax=Georgfuchsia toluolica TaxID=424218 RepID=A0A916J1E4_9PROT|nr:flagellar export chaperone FliS [Georgfuchsia toluolica]CAG4882207.1 Flagellar secretion chaperone FliS [Georgfuchsia toluolica]
MFATPHTSAVKAYARVGIETDIVTADPHKLIVMLYEGARLSIATAKLHMQRNEIGAKGEAISKAISIIDQGLKASLDVNAGGKIAEKLYALYEYMCRRLLLANLKNQPEMLDEVAGLLGELNEAWNSIGKGLGSNTTTTENKLRRV